jgi:transposase-like protein
MRCWAGEVKNVSVLVAIGVDQDGYRHVLGVQEGAKETLSYYDFPRQHWRSLRTNNPLERLMREIRRRTRVVGAFPDGQSALMLVAARLRHVSTTKWGSRQYLNIDRLTENIVEMA